MLGWRHAFVKSRSYTDGNQQTVRNVIVSELDKNLKRCERELGNMEETDEIKKLESLCPVGNLGMSHYEPSLCYRNVLS